MLKNVVIRHPAAGQWLVFSEPLEVLQATTPEDVLAVLGEAERQVNERQLFAAGYLCYEAAPGLDPALVTRDGCRLPLVCLGLFERVEQVGELAPSGGGPQPAARWQMAGSRERYLRDVAAIKRQIELGNTYQTNYTLRLHAAGIADPWALFVAASAGAPYAAYVDCVDHAIVSASPELFFSLDGDSIVSRPMKGTSRRGRTVAEDLSLREELLHSAKNRAENIMITDLLRNDLGRVAAPGTVAVSRTFEVEKYPTVWQMTSTVSASTQAPITAIFQALFPCASITGAPKRSSMSIIAGLEDAPREIYTGSIGFMGPERRAQFNVAIRTALVDRKTGDAVCGVGGGIVWDSDPDEEYRECQVKARVFSAAVDGGDFQLLETMRWRPEEGFFLLDEHLDRLCASAGYFDFAADRAWIEESLDRFAAGLPRAAQRVRLLLSREGRLQLSQAALDPLGGAQPRSIGLARQPVDSTDPFLFHKTTRRAAYERALADAGDDGDVLLWNEDGYLTESCIANVIVTLRGERCTPPVECGLLAGTYRRWLLEQGAVTERRIHVEELADAGQVTLVNSVRGEYPVRLRQRAG